MDNKEKITGFVRTAIISAVIFLFLSFLLKGVAAMLAVFFAKLGGFAPIGVALLNIAGAALSIWVASRAAVAGHKVKNKLSGIIALTLATVTALMELVSGIGSDLILTMAGRQGSFLSSILQAVGSFIVIFTISKTVFRKRESVPEAKEELPKEKLSFKELLGM